MLLFCFIIRNLFYKKDGEFEVVDSLPNTEPYLDLYSSKAFLTSGECILFISSIMFLTFTYFTPILSKN